MHCVVHDNKRICSALITMPQIELVMRVQVLSLPSSGTFGAESFSHLANGKCNFRVASLAISNDLQKIAIGCSDGSVAVANVEDAIASYKFVKRHDGASLGCSR
jgi:hypothetical protein